MILYILHSVGARRCPDTSTKCPPGCNSKGHYNGNAAYKIREMNANLLEVVRRYSTGTARDIGTKRRDTANALKRVTATVTR